VHRQIWLDPYQPDYERTSGLCRASIGLPVRGKALASGIFRRERLDQTGGSTISCVVPGLQALWPVSDRPNHYPGGVGDPRPAQTRAQRNVAAACRKF